MTGHGLDHTTLSFGPSTWARAEGMKLSKQQSVVLEISAACYLAHSFAISGTLDQIFWFPSL
jgi:hypothetical protein